jgi:hypothetical protein
LEIKSGDTNDLVLNQAELIILRSIAATFLNQLEVIATAWTHEIADRTIIEDTESSIDLIVRGWSLYNYPSRLAYSATPADFGSLLIQRRRWATLIDGSTALHWAGGAEGKGLLCTGDTIYVVADNRWVTFMYSYPNDIPLDAASVRHIADSVRPYPFERLYAAFGRPVECDAHAAVQRSAERYIRHISGAA